ncbi:hypothetical protein [Rhizobium ruizarguesonis]|uniref:hypothetical protein n=1 Tax=Rhizobium ruizarguesonis TaxID=2081791 RepID=UPI001FDEE27D|nr:hypothetical protein [Rhizobium ruizarguesonis]
MVSKKLNLKSREALAELSLHDKNAYLQEVAGLIMAVRGEEPRRSLPPEELCRGTRPMAMSRCLINDRKVACR